MPYSNRWGITATKVSAGVFDVTSEGRTVRVTIDQTYADDIINAAFALFRAIQALYPDDPTWRLRAEYAVSRWKIDGYNASINGVPANQRAPWRAKRDAWVAEEARLKAIMGADA